ncbi:MAG: superoxide dismutase [Parcubacteria group bacterium]|nr:superoxide dismutase [Parcubacteria group bacterium]
MSYTLPSLKYAYNGLEPYIDAKTMEIHHTKHHQAYLDNLNKVLAKYPAFEGKSVEDLLRNLAGLKMDEADKLILKNHGGGFINHNLFWEIMGPSKEVDAELVSDVEKAFGSVDEFKKQFTQKAVSQFGSGWAWLARDSQGKLLVYSLPNQDSPYLRGDTPIIGLDVWEHAYYLKYQNRRAEYAEQWWAVLKLIP